MDPANQPQSAVRKLSAYSYRLALLFWWAVLTATYAFLLLFASLVYRILPSKIGVLIAALIYAPASVIGFFVPFGFYNFVAAVTSLRGVVVLSLFIYLLVRGDAIARALRINSAAKKMLFNLGYLFLATLLVDFVLWLHWISLTFFYGKGLSSLGLLLNPQFLLR